MRPHPISLFHAVPATRNGAYGAKKILEYFDPEIRKRIQLCIQILVPIKYRIYFQQVQLKDNYLDK